MPRALRIGLWSLLALVVLIIAVAGIFALTFDPNSYKPRIIAAVKQQTGRDLTLEGPIHLGLSLRPTLSVQGASLANPPGFSRPQMVTLQRLDLQLALLPLLHHQVDITRLILVKPDILLEIDAQGHPNWQFTPQPGASATQGGASTGGEKTSTSISVAEVRVENGTITWRDDATGKSAVLGVSSLETTAASADANMHLAMSAAYDGNPFTFNGDVGPLAALESGAGASAWPVQFNVAAAGATLAVKGSIKQPEQFRGYALKVTANVPDLTRLGVFAPGAKLPPLHDIQLAMQLADTGAKLPAISNLTLHIGQSDLGATLPGLRIDKLDVEAPQANQPVKLAAQGTFGNAPATLNGSVGVPPTLLSGGTLGGTVPIDLSGQLLGSNLVVKGTAGEGTDGRPSIAATVTADKIDADMITAALPKPAPAPAAAPVQAAPPPVPAASGQLIPDTPIPFHLLRTADADVKLDIGELKSAGVVYKSIATHIALQNGRLRVDPFSANFPEGHLDAALTADATQAQPPVTVRLNAPSLALRPLFAAMNKPDLISGNLEVHADLSGAGETPHAIAASLNGTLGVSLADGTIDNRLLGSTLQSVLREVNLLDLVGRGGASQVQCFAARLTASHGIATVQPLVLSSSLLTMEGSGTIDLRNETLDLHLRPQGRIAGTELIVPLQVTGSLRAPSARPDPAAAVAANAGTVAGAVIGGTTPLGMIAGALGGKNLLGGSETVNCGAALALARGEAVSAPPAAPSAPPAAPAPRPKVPNPGQILRQLFR